MPSTPLDFSSRGEARYLQWRASIDPTYQLRERKFGTAQAIAAAVAEVSAAPIDTGMSGARASVTAQLAMVAFGKAFSDWLDCDYLPFVDALDRAFDVVQQALR